MDCLRTSSLGPRSRRKPRAVAGLNPTRKALIASLTRPNLSRSPSAEWAVARLQPLPASGPASTRAAPSGTRVCARTRDPSPASSPFDRVRRRVPVSTRVRVAWRDVQSISPERPVRWARTGAHMSTARVLPFKHSLAERCRTSEGGFFRPLSRLLPRCLGCAVDVVGLPATRSAPTFRPPDPSHPPPCRARRRSCSVPRAQRIRTSDVASRRLNAVPPPPVYLRPLDALFLDTRTSLGGRLMPWPASAPLTPPSR